MMFVCIDMRLDIVRQTTGSSPVTSEHLLHMFSQLSEHIIRTVVITIIRFF